MHISSIRLCTHAQWEIRQLFVEIKKAVTKLNPFLGALLTVKCDTLGCCPEFNCCGRHPKKVDVLVKS